MGQGGRSSAASNSVIAVVDVPADWRPPASCARKLLEVAQAVYARRVEQELAA